MSESDLTALAIYVSAARDVGDALNAEVESLVATKNRLMNEEINGRLVGMARRSPRRTKPGGAA